MSVERLHSRAATSRAATCEFLRYKRKSDSKVEAKSKLQRHSQDVFNPLIGKSRPWGRKPLRIAESFGALLYRRLKHSQHEGDKFVRQYSERCPLGVDHSGATLDPAACSGRSIDLTHL